MYTWMDNETQVVLDEKCNVINRIYEFIETETLTGLSVLVHSFRGMNRSVVVCAAYLMKKFNWSVDKTMEFIKSKKCNVQLRGNFLR
jgi:protein-tyrosine phosphatase